MIGDVKALIEFQTKLQGVANSVAKEMVDALNASDRELLETVRKGIVKPFNGKSLKESYERLQTLCKQVYEIRKKAIDNAKIVMEKNGEKIADKISSQALENLKNSTKKKIKPVPKKKLEDIIKYQPFQGKTIEDWFKNWTESDKYRIVAAIQQAVNEGITPQKAINLIRGTINPNTGKREGGILDVSRNSASMIARTITNGVANEARLATLDENDDVIDGYQFLATLDGKTSFLCASLDGTIWLNKDRDKVKRPPLHPNCRSTLIPYIILHDENGNVIEDEDSRPMANADFDQYAKEQYEKKYPGKKFSDLAQTTRDNYYYKAQNQYEKETGKPAYSQTSGKTTFKDYFENQPDDFKRSWLGEKRFELYKDGKLKFDQLVKPDSGYVVPVSELGQKDGPDMPPTVPSSTKPPGSPKDGDNTSNNPDIEDSAEKNVLEQSDGKGDNSKHGKELERQARDAAEKKSIREQNKGKYTADELKNPNQILTVEDFNAAFEEKKKYFDEIEKLVREKVEQELREFEARKDTITEEEHEKKKTKIRLPLDVVVERRRRAILDTLWPDTNPNSNNRKALKENDNISQDRFIPSAIYPDWYWDTDTKRIVNISGIPSTQSARQHKKADNTVLRRFRQGKDLLGRILDNMGIDASAYIGDVEFHGIRDRGYFAEANLLESAGRNFLSNDLIILSNKKRRATAATVAHELTHFLELHIPNLRSRVKSLYLTLVDNGNGGLNIQKRIPGSGTAVRRKGRTRIENAEYYRDANIPVPNVYCMRDYGQCEGKELLSVFITTMIEEPERIVAEYPDYFNAMMGCLKQ